jgi:membrane protein
MLRRLVVSTVSGCFRYRVSGLAAEAAFFAILSLPPLVFGLVGTVGYVAETFDVRTVEQVRAGIVEIAGRVLTPQSVDQIVVPTIDDVLAGGRADVVSVGFVLALWSGSRALNVVIDTITIMYGLGGRRGIVKTRALSFVLYAVALLVGVVLLPLLLAGPSFVSAVVPARLGFVTDAYWPLVLGGSVVFLALLYHLSVPVRTPFHRDLPGAALCLVLWVAGSWLLRWALSAASGSTSVYGPLAAPIAVLAWLYLLAIAVLIGAALNAAVDSEVQPRATSARRAPLRARLGGVVTPGPDNRVRPRPPPL